MDIYITSLNLVNTSFLFFFYRCFIQSFQLHVMQCKECKFTHPNVQTLLKHYRLRHAGGHQGRIWPCLYADCVCTFRTPGNLKCHLSRYHTKKQTIQATTTFRCEHCTFQDICSASAVSSHLGGHLRNGELVTCPFVCCGYKTNKFGSFATHKSRKHRNHTVEDIKSAVSPVGATDDVDTELSHSGDGGYGDEGPSSHAAQNPELDPDLLLFDDENVETSTLERKLASLFLSMQTVLHVSKGSTQIIIKDL